MSQETVEIMRKAVGAFNRRDRDAWLPLIDPEVEWKWRFVPEWPESETFRGREALWDWMVSGNEVWERADYEIVEVIDDGNNQLGVRFKRPVKGKASGIVSEFDYWCVYAFRGGKILSTHWFANRAQALEAMGLRE